LREIIFGYKVCLEEKKKIINIIKDKRRKLNTGSYDIKFYDVILGKDAPMVELIYDIS
jgi:hypothetical protein